MTSASKSGKGKYVPKDKANVDCRLNVLRAELADAITAYKKAVSEATAPENLGAGDATSSRGVSGERERINRLAANMERLEAEINELDPLTQLRKDKSAAIKETNARKRLQRLEQEQAEAERQRQRRDQFGVQSLAVIREEVSMLLDEANNAYQCFINKSITKEDGERKMLTLREKLSMCATDARLIVDDRYKNDAEACVTGAYAAVANYQSMITNGDQLFTNVDDWESLLPDTPEEPVVVPNGEIQRKLLDGVSLSFPFSDLKPTFEETASHPVCNAARVVGSTMLYMKAAKMARVFAEHHYNPKKPPVVMDVGAGSFGSKRLQMLKAVPMNAKVAMHAMIPVVQDADNARDSRARHNGTFLQWNYLPETKEPSVTRLNYCRHVASECDCLKYYDERARHVLAVHSAYYFKVCDWKNLFKYTDQIETLLHVPKIGQTLPLRVPEFEWVDSGTDASSDWLTRFGCKVKQLLTGDRTVKLKPLKHGETTYEHTDMSQIITRGGFHFADSTDWIDEYCQGDRKTAIAAVTVAAAGAIGGLAAAVGSPPIVAAASTVAGAINALVTTAAYARAVSWRARAQRPMFVNRTVTCHVATAFSPNGEEDVVTTQRFKCGPPRQLTPEPIESVRIAEEQVGRVAAAIAMAKDTATATRQMAASLLRENTPIQAARDTLSHAVRIASYVIPNGQSPLSGGRMLSLAIVSPLCVLAPVAALTWIPAAVSLPTTVIPIAVAASLLVKLLCIPTALALFLLSCSG